MFGIGSQTRHVRDIRPSCRGLHRCHVHLAGVTTAVASCRTAFGGERLAMLRRLMMDDSFFAAS